MSICPAVVIVQCAEVVYLGFCKKKRKEPTFEKKFLGRKTKTLPREFLI